jgi:DNA-binding transcriptional LysR family regulator
MKEESETSFRDLRYFNLVAELNHMGKAADLLGRGQPTLTKAIQRLEGAVGGQLFVRHSKGMSLTPTGEMLYQRTRELRSSVAVTIAEARRFAQGDRGMVRVGCSPVAAERVLPVACLEMKRLHAGVTLQVTVSQSGPLFRLLEAGEIDLVVAPLQDANVPMHSEVLAEDTVVIAGHRQHPIFQEEVPSLAATLRFPWALPPRSAPTRLWLDGRFTEAGLPRPQVQVEANSIPLLRRILSGSELLTFIPRGCLDLADWLREVPLPSAALSRPLVIAHRTDRYLPPAATNLIEVLRQVVKPTS